MAEIDELKPRPGESVPMDYAEHERSYHIFLRVLLTLVLAAVLFILGWLYWV